MNGKLTGLFVAAAFGAVASLGAQTTSTTAQSPHGSMTSSSGEVTITGCLQKGADGNYILTNARLDNNGSTSGSTASGTTGSATTGTTGSTMTGTTGTSGSTATGATTTADPGSKADAAATWQLSGGTDLDKHVGHRIQVTGRAEGASGSETGSTTTGTTATGTSGTTSGTTGTTYGSMQHEGGASAAAHKLDVQSVKMVSTSCS